MKKGLIIGAVVLVMVLATIFLLPHTALAADAFGKAENSLRNVGLQFQKVLKWVGITAFLFGAAQYTVGRKQQGKFYMISAAVGYAFVLAVFIIFSIIEGIFGGLV